MKRAIRRRICAAGPLAASLVGVVGFGTLYSGVVDHSLATLLLGLALALFGLDRAGRALAASILLAEARRGGGTARSVDPRSAGRSSATDAGAAAALPAGEIAVPAAAGPAAKGSGPAAIGAVESGAGAPGGRTHEDGR